MIRTLLTSLALLAVLTGCASDSDPEPEAATTSESSTAGAEVMTADEASALVASGATLVDVRNPDEYAAGHVEGAESIPWESGDFDAAVEPLDRDATYVLYCASGRRAGEALARMTELGFTDVHNAGGLEDVADVVGPVVTDD
ncbi:rhodanese-like domain-containing protein [Nocardioides terrigena]|uniref:rhodanese-like domain-containing protein n=1 Tax=Nocardioides terrigena TaxID=424797 RepID=UPI000D326912|nr:rhodanese-like domain-containing protein [Nocardioides terrigena]